MGGERVVMNALVTGGGGFLGGAIVRRLVARGDRVRSLSRRRYAELDALGVEQIQGDVADLGPTETAIQGCDVVFHVAAKAGVWGAYADYYRANVVGTQNVTGRLPQTRRPSPRLHQFAERGFRRPRPGRRGRIHAVSQSTTTRRIPKPKRKPNDSYWRRTAPTSPRLPCGRT